VAAHCRDLPKRLLLSASQLGPRIPWSGHWARLRALYITVVESQRKPHAGSVGNVDREPDHSRDQQLDGGITMSQCQHWKDGTCALAATIAVLNARPATNDAACEACSAHATAPRDVNNVTVSLAVSHLHRRDPQRAREVLDQYGHLLVVDSPAPTLLDQAWSVTRAVTTFVAGGGATVDKTTYQARLGVCDACPQRDNQRCKRCGCFVSVKAKFPAEKCPLGLWPAQSPAEMEDAACKS